MSKKQIKRCYFVTSDYFEDGAGIAVISDSARHAKLQCVEYDEYISIRVKWNRHIDASNLPYGEVDAKDGLKLEIYSYVEDYCSVCGVSDSFYLDHLIDDEFVCEACQEEASD